MCWLTQDGYRVTSACAFEALGFSGYDCIHLFTGFHWFCNYYRRGY